VRIRSSAFRLRALRPEFYGFNHPAGHAPCDDVLRNRRAYRIIERARGQVIEVDLQNHNVHYMF
jgi:hypothetical protein